MEKNKEYDCIIGLSGGIDSSYLTLKAKDWGPRPLVVHVDAGWNSELAVSNIEKIIKYSGFDLHTEVIDWDIMREASISIFKNLGFLIKMFPRIIFFSLLSTNTQSRIRLIILLVVEIFQLNQYYQISGSDLAMDAISLKEIFKKFGEGSLKNYRTISFFQYYFWCTLL